MCGVPLPVFGNAFKIVKTMGRLNMFTKYPIVEFMEDCFGPKIPKLLMFVISVSPLIAIADPEIVNELYITKNKYFDKHLRIKN